MLFGNFSGRAVKEKAEPPEAEDEKDDEDNDNRQESAVSVNGVVIICDGLAGARLGLKNGLLNKFPAIFSL